jgi:hypothetical protein
MSITIEKVLSFFSLIQRKRPFVRRAYDTRRPVVT